MGGGSTWWGLDTVCKKGADWSKSSGSSLGVAVAQTVGQGVVVARDDVDCALAALKSRSRDALGAPKIPSVTWDDVGGLEDAKKAIR